MWANFGKVSPWLKKVKRLATKGGEKNIPFRSIIKGIYNKQKKRGGGKGVMPFIWPSARPDGEKMV